MSEDTLAADLLAVLEVVVLEREAEGKLRLIGKVPEWFARFRPEAASGDATLTNGLESPFLENFLIDAETFWSSNGSGRLKSGLWTETGPLGTDFHMEASAVSIGGRRILLIEYRALDYKQTQSMLQTARSRKLRAREAKRAEEPGTR